MLLTGKNITKNIGERTLFHIDKIQIHDGDRIGLVGANGAGKTTLLCMLLGEDQDYSGYIGRFGQIAMVTQQADPLYQADGEQLKRLGIHNSCHSGGEQTRLAIAAALSQNASLLLADEPTTNLDMKGIKLVEQALENYQGAVVVVSHDRALLDGICKTIWAIEDGVIRLFPGNYSNWLMQKQKERDFAQFEYQQYQAEKKRLSQAQSQVIQESRQMLKRPKHMGSSEWLLYKDIAANQQKNMQSRAKAIEKRINHLEVKEKPQQLPQVHMQLGALQTIVSRQAVSVEHLNVTFGQHQLIQDGQFTLPTGQRTVMIGANGAGKSTIVKAILAYHPACRLAPGMTIGYFDQQHINLDLDKTVLENACLHSQLPNHHVRSILANLNIDSNQLHQLTASLSGGERAKVVFAQLLASQNHLLILDEPTNHLDFYGCEALEQMLLKWQGTLLVITHDRALAKAIAQRILVVENNQVTTYEGDWSFYESLQVQTKSADHNPLNLERIQMDMAELVYRLSNPQKGDQKDELEERWRQLLKQYRQCKHD